MRFLCKSRPKPSRKYHGLHNLALLIYFEPKPLIIVRIVIIVIRTSIQSE